MAALAIALGPLAGCETPPRQGARPTSQSGVFAAPNDASRGGGQQQIPVAAWQEQTVTLEELRPALTELAGATALRDAFLDARIERALAEARITIDADAIARERTQLVRSLDADPNVGERLLQDIRARQGLGPTRFDALMRRNASLRALVQRDVRVTDDALERQHEVLHGPARTARIISVQSLRDAADVQAELAGGATFNEVASRRSTDVSAARGGLLAPISKADPTWPQSFRDALFALAPNEVSPPTAVEGGYVLIQFLEERAADGVTLATARADVEAALRSAQERVLMDERARAFLNEISPQFYDEAFSAAWRRAK